MTDLYKKIEDLCNAYNITITQMCRDINMSRSIMSEFKSGRTKYISDKSIKIIAKYFNVSPEYLTGRDVSRILIKSNYTDIDMNIINLLPVINIETKMKILKLINNSILK